MAQATPFLVWPVAQTTLSFQLCPVSGTGYTLPHVTGYTLPNVPNGTGYTLPPVASGTGYTFLVWPVAQATPFLV